MDKVVNGKLHGHGMGLEKAMVAEVPPLQVRLEMVVKMVERALARVHRTNQRLYAGIGDLERYPLSDNGLGGRMDDLVQLSRQLDDAVNALVYRLGD